MYGLLNHMMESKKDLCVIEEECTNEDSSHEDSWIVEEPSLKYENHDDNCKDNNDGNFILVIIVVPPSLRGNLWKRHSLIVVMSIFLTKSYVQRKIPMGIPRINGYMTYKKEITNLYHHITSTNTSVTVTHNNDVNDNRINAQHALSKHWL